MTAPPDDINDAQETGARFFGRVSSGGTAHHAAIEGDVATLLDGPPWLGGAPTGARHPLAKLTLLAPVTPSKIMAVGRNFRAHITEMGYEVPSEPSIFMKPPTAVIGSGADVVLPPHDLSQQVEHEAEVALVIGRYTRSVTAQDALGHVFGITAANDVTARDLQGRDAYPIRAKGFDTFCPLGPWIAAGLDLTNSLRVWCRVNGELRQEGHTADLVFGFAEIVARVSQFTTLLPGDVVLTGSPGGSGLMREGDQIEVGVDNVGTLRHRVATPK